MGFVTKIDYSDNRQIKQFELTTTDLSGTTVFGVPYNTLTGVDESSVTLTNTITGITSTFSGNTNVTNISFGDPRMVVASSSLFAITDTTSGLTQNAIGFEGSDSGTTVDGNLIYETYSGSSYDLSVTSIEEIATDTWTGETISDVLLILSGTSADYTGSTIWVDVQGITQTKRLIITDELDLLSGNTKVLTRDDDGNVHETYITGHTENDYVTGTTFNTSTGDLISTRLSGGTIVTSLDGRYLTAETDSQTLSFSANTGDLEISNSGNTVNLDGRYSLTGHTHPSDNTDDHVTGSTFNSGTGVLTLNMLSGGTVNVDLDDRYVEWTGLWADTQYTINQQALDGDYLGIANKTTEDRLAPQASSDKEYGITGTTATTQSNISVVNSGHEYTFTESGWVNELRVFVSELTNTTNYRVVVLDITNSGTPISNIYESPLLEANEWSTVTIGQRFVKPGTRFRIYIDALNSGSNSQVTGGWTRGSNQQGTAPAAESWNTNNQGSIVRIDKTDLNTTDRASELNGIIIDSILQFVETASPSNLIKFRTISTPIDSGTYVEYSTIKIEEDFGGPTVGETSTLTADVPIPQSTEYKEIVDYWLTNEPSWATVDGILEYDGVIQGGVIDNAYGVDIGFTAAYLSPDWDIISVNGGTGGSGGTGDQTLAFSASTGDLNISDGNTVNLDNRYSLTGHTHASDNTDDYVTEHAFNTSTGILESTRLSGGTIQVDLDGRYSLTGHTHASDNTDDFLTGGTFNTTNGELSLNLLSGSTIVVDLDDRYSLTGHTHGISDITGFTDNSVNWDEAYDDSITGMTVTGTTSKTIILTQRDGDTITANFTDINTDTNDYTTGSTFNTATGLLEFTRLSGDTYSVNLDNRYALSGDTGGVNTDDYLTGSTFNTSTGELIFNMLSGSTISVNLDNRYALSGDTGSAQTLSWTGETGNLEISDGNIINLGFEFVDTGVGFTFGTPDDKIIITGDLEFEAAAVSGFSYTFPEKTGIVALASWETITGSTYTSIDSGKYIADSASRVVFTMPQTNNPESVRVTGKGVGGWQIDVPIGWTFTFVNQVITGDIQSTEMSDSVELICTGNNAYHVISSTGNIIFNNL